MNYGPHNPHGHHPGYGHPYQQPPPYAFYRAPPAASTSHPLAHTALWLGIASMLFGALLGAPAILCGRKAVGEIKGRPDRYTGVGTAQTGVVLGWISVVGTAVLAATAITTSWRIAVPLIVASILGLTLLALSAVRLPNPLSAITQTMRRTPLALGLSLGGLLLGSSLGLVRVNAAEEQRARDCVTATQRQSDAVKEEAFAGARNAIDEMKLHCRTPESELVALREGVAKKESDAQKRSDEAARRKVVEAAAEKERIAVATFPAQSKEIATRIKSAQSLGWQGKWEESSASLDAAQSDLDAFDGTSIEQSKDSVDLQNQIAAQVKVTQPQLDRQRKEQVARAEASAKREEALCNARRAARERCNDRCETLDSEDPRWERCMEACVQRVPLGGDCLL